MFSVLRQVQLWLFVVDRVGTEAGAKLDIFASGYTKIQRERYTNAAVFSILREVQLWLFGGVFVGGSSENGG